MDKWELPEKMVEAISGGNEIAAKKVAQEILAKPSTIGY